MGRGGCLEFWMRCLDADAFQAEACDSGRLGDLTFTEVTEMTHSRQK